MKHSFELLILKSCRYLSKEMISNDCLPNTSSLCDIIYSSSCGCVDGESVTLYKGTVILLSGIARELKETIVMSKNLLYNEATAKHAWGDLPCPYVSLYLKKDKKLSPYLRNLIIRTSSPLLNNPVKLYIYQNFQTLVDIFDSDTEDILYEFLGGNDLNNSNICGMIDLPPILVEEGMKCMSGRTCLDIIEAIHDYYN